ncbi:response regulator [Halobacillus locisalis]|uniref:Response regulator n=1 Tax=Halobacillus locisalis TaxID=220753 RepID=A0A838CTV9_9BACI|nr:response regulator [Halobacillus locisalis]MBA2175249.1 response regulator [Halobacillus locisalis]
MANQILIVDDQSGIRLLLEEILKSDGYQTLSAKTGKQACDLAETNEIDLMIMDYNLPVMHGREVLEKMRERGCKHPVIVITGEAKETVEKDIDHPFVRAVITKPFDIHKLKELVAGELMKSL